MIQIKKSEAKAQKLHRTGSCCKKYLSIEFSLFRFIILMMIYQYGKSNNKAVDGGEKEALNESSDEKANAARGTTGRRGLRVR